MDFAQIITQSSYIQTSNNFYCNMKLLSSFSSKYSKSSKVIVLPSKEILAFSFPNFSFIPSNVRNSFQEAIVISTVSDNNIFADATNNWIKKHKDKNHHSLFYKEIFKALLTKKIEVVALPSLVHSTDSPGILTQLYMWNKGWKQPFSLLFPINNNTPRVSDSSRKFLMDQLSASPVFVVKNGFNEIILGHPVSRIKKSILHQPDCLGFNSTRYPQTNGPVSNGLFFFHPDDAAEFKNFLQSAAPLASEHMAIKVEPIGLHFAYKMNRNLVADTQFRFVPDLKEVGDLIFKYTRDKNLIFHKNQYYGKDFFQGQPIYMIQPITIKGKNGKLDVIKFTGINDNRDVIFTNREAAYNSWKNFIKDKPILKSINKPTLLVYNLESFLKEIELSGKDDLKKFVIITHKKAYVATKELMTLSDSNSLFKHIKLNIKPKLFFVKLWIRRLLSTLAYE